MPSVQIYWWDGRTKEQNNFTIAGTTYTTKIPEYDSHKDGIIMNAELSARCYFLPVILGAAVKYRNIGYSLYSDDADTEPEKVFREH